jgi:hypothetical protein
MEIMRIFKMESNVKDFVQTEGVVDRECRI